MTADDYEWAELQFQYLCGLDGDTENGASLAALVEQYPHRAKELIDFAYTH